MWFKRLAFDLKAELEKREQRFDVVQERVAELKERAKLQETPIQMQVNGMRNISIKIIFFAV